MDSRKLHRVFLGEFPPNSKAKLKVICFQQLDFSDCVYFFKLPAQLINPYFSGDENDQFVSPQDLSKVEWKIKVVIDNFDELSEPISINHKKIETVWTD